VPPFPTASGGGSGSATPVGLTISGHTATLSIATVPYVTCDLSDDRDAADRGSWGLEVDSGATASIETITVVR
jgi:hypothetical protein